LKFATRRCCASQVNLTALQRLTSTDRDAIRPRINRTDVARHICRNGESSPLSNGETSTPLVLTHNLTALINDLTRLRRPAARAKERPIVSISDETDLLALRLLCRCEPTRARRISHLTLRHLTEWEACTRNRLATEAVQEVGLILVAIYSGPQSPARTIGTHRASRIVARSNRITSEERTPLPHQRAKLHRRIASNTGARCLTVKIRTDERLKDRCGELALKVLDVEWDLQLISNAAGIICSVQRTAALSATVYSIRRIMQTHPDTYNFVSHLN
jgi:hypothetical protein